MGVVYEASNADECVAIKMLYADSVSDALAVSRFDDEASAGTLVRHPAVVAVLERGETEEGYPYLVMERVDGESLSSRIEKRELSIREAAMIAISVLDGLDALHAAELVHGDVKSDNVLVDRRSDGSLAAKLIDLGLARRVGSVDPDPHMISGTPLYMAPELIRGGQATPASDLYAAAVMLYEALTGRTPFSGSTAAQVFQCHLEDSPAAPSTWTAPGTIPPVLDEIVLRALEKDPVERFESVADFACALAATLPGLADVRAGRPSAALGFEATCVDASTTQLACGTRR
jgi:serine/threonine-protein kinase